MLIILLTLITTSAARTTRSFVYNDNFSRSYIPVLNLSITPKSGNGHQWVPKYSYPSAYEGGVSLSDIVFQGHTSNLLGSVNTQNTTKDSFGQWNRRNLTETTQLSDRFSSSNTEQIVSAYVKDQTTEKMQMFVKGTNENHHFNRGVNNTIEISTQSYDVIASQLRVSNSTRNNLNRTANANNVLLRTNKTSNSHPSFDKNDINGSTNPTSIYFYHSSTVNGTDENRDNKNITNVLSIDTRNNTLITNNNINNSTNVTKTSQDNEVVTSTDQVKSNKDDDKWIWSNAKVETTTIEALDNRAAFAGGNCPTGTVRFQDRCVPVD